MWVRRYSAENAGTTTVGCLTRPQDIRRDNVLEKGHLLSTPPQTIRVLVVDDHDVVRHGLLTVLAGEPDVEVAGRARAGAQVLGRHPRRASDPFFDLTARELDVLRLVAVGEPNKQIARELGISERTARTHVSRILQKLSLSSRTQAALWAVREGLVELDAPRR